MSDKKIVYVDMDNVLVDFQSGIDMLTDDEKIEYNGRVDEVDGIFSNMLPMPNAIESFNKLCEKFDVYILSTAPWDNPSAWTDKLNWVKKYLGENGYKRLILSHNKHLNVGDYLIDDRKKNGAEKFSGELILFGSPEFKDWNAVVKYLINV